jgi:iron-only hydrogenase group A
MKKIKITITINNEKINCFKGQTVLEVAQENNIDIPSLCHHSDLEIKANCRLCLVKLKKDDCLYTSCSLKAEQGMEIITESAEINKARKINLELVFAQHCEECNDCVWRYNCQMLDLAKKYKVDITRFFDRKKNYPVYQFGRSLIFDSSKCIDCRNCVDVCHQQTIDFLEIKEKDHLCQIVPSKDKNKNCIYCGQCIVHCPAGAFEGVGEFEDIEKPLLEKDKVVVFQFAPSIRTSIGEEFNLPLGSVLTDKLVAGIKKLKVDKVFDVSVGADITTVEEAEELVERLAKKKNLPMFTSCCPAWVKFVEFYQPEIIPFLTSVRSPHIILGGLIKTFWAEQEKIDPTKIVVVSVMPCVAKKHEIKREELKINGLRPVDYVLTTRELAFLFKKHKIDLKKIKPEKPDSPLAIPTGAGVIYGASGGVMESALRTAYFKIFGKNLKKIEFEKVRGMEGVKKAVIKIKGKKIKIAVVNGIKNARKILEEIKKDPGKYHYIEVMSCFGGCIGGGGQPVPTDAKIRTERALALYQVDHQKKIRLAHENKFVKKIYQDFFQSKERIHSICHTKYFPEKK